MTDSPLAALLDAYDKVVLRWERAGYLAAVEPEAIAARAAILAEFATLEADTGYYWNLATKMKIALDALRAEGEECRIEEDTQVALAAIRMERGRQERLTLSRAEAEGMLESYDVASHTCEGWNRTWEHPYKHYIDIREDARRALLAALTQGREG